MTGIAPQPRLARLPGVLTRVSVNVVKELFAMLLPIKPSVRALPELWATRGQNVDNWNALRVLIVLWEDLVSKTNVWMPAGNILSAIHNMFLFFFVFKGVSVYKPFIVFVVIHEKLKYCYC